MLAEVLYGNYLGFLLGRQGKHVGIYLHHDNFGNKTFGQLPCAALLPVLKRSVTLRIPHIQQAGTLGEVP